MMETDILKYKIIEKLKEVNREGMNNLINYLENESDYFEAPASTKYHLSIKRGLILHSWSLYKLFKSKVKQFNLDVSEETIILCSLLHDLCKIGCYVPNGESFSWNPSAEGGHSLLSIKRITKFIKLTEQETELMRFHMGVYGTKEFGFRGEYTIKEMTDVYNRNKLAKLFYFCDDMSTQFLEG